MTILTTIHKYRFQLIRYLSIVLMAGACQSSNLPESESKAEKPNIILIMSDDMGYSDLGCYGGEINTPNLDYLAKNGLQFTQFYNTARCCPTRASLLTGLYPHQAGIGHMTNPPGNPTGHNYGFAEYQGSLSKNTRTIAEVLGDAGYTTLMSGKWHLGMEDSTQWPLQRGFDKYYGILSGASNYFKPMHPRGITEQNEQIEISDEQFYTTDAFTQKAIGFIGETKEAPFFLYLAYTSPHWPIQAPKEEIDKYRNKYLEGWAKLREARYIRQQELGLIDSQWKLSPQDGKEWESLPKEKQEEMALRMAIYAAQIDRMDQNVGKLINYLKETNKLDNTLIIFLDDNGACAEGGMLGGGSADLLETREGFFLTYGQSWANASNTPFREYKHYIHEGGISTPLIVHWPAGIDQAKQGSKVKQYGFLPDIMATLVDLSGATYSQDSNIPPMQGESLLPIIKGAKANVHEKPIFWEHEGNKAVRLGKYKLVMKWKDKDSNHWELYDIDADRSEQHDLAAQMPDKVSEMQTMWEEWASANNVKSWNEIIDILSSK